MKANREKQTGKQIKPLSKVAFSISVAAGKALTGKLCYHGWESKLVTGGGIVGGVYMRVCVRLAEPLED